MAEQGEKELEDFLTDVFEGREPGEQPEPPTEEPEAPEEEEVIRDVPPEREPEVAPAAEEPPPAEPEPEPEPEEPGSVAWAKRKYGDDPEKWAYAAYQQEQHISRIASEKQQAEQLAKQMAEYAQFAEQQAVDHQTQGMPLSAQEEAWIDQGLSNPLNYAYAALEQGNVPLYNGLIERLAEDNPALAANVGAQAQMAIQQNQAQQRVQADAYAARQSDFPTVLGESIGRLGIDLKNYGEAMSTKIAELGEYHPYTQTIMNSPDPGQRDLALMAVYDLVRTGQLSTKRVEETDREAQIRREQELRREAASIVTGSPHVEAKKESPFMQSMIDEWKRAGQWSDDEG